MKKYDLIVFLKKLNNISNDEIKILVLDNEIQDVEKEMVDEKEGHLVDNPHVAYESIEEVIPSNHKLKYLNELLFLKSTLQNSKKVTFEDFIKLEIRVGTILSAHFFEKARKPSYILKIDFGEEIGIKQSSAQITDYYDLDSLSGRQIVAVVNFPPRQIANFFSEVLVLGAIEDDGKVVLLALNQKVKNGIKIG